MHIVIDARFINSGTGTYVLKLLEYLQEIDTTNHYTVLVPTKDINYWQPREDNFIIKGIDIPMYSFAEQLTYKKILDDLKPDLVHFAMPQQPLWYKGKRVTTIHDLTLLKTYNSDKNWLIFHIKQLVGRWVFKRIAQISDHVIAISRNTKREYQEFSHIADDKISVIYEAGQTPKVPLAACQLPFQKFLLYVGQQPDYKNLRRLADAHQLLLQKYPDLGLVFAGRMNEDTKRNQRYYQEKGYKNIHFTGFIPDEQRDWLFAHTEAYVFPSLMEGFGLPPLEAMAQGAPVVASDASCLPEILGDAALYFNPLKSQAIAAAIEHVLLDSSLRSTLIKRGYQQVKKYSWRRMAEQTYAIYMQLLKS